MLFLLFVLQFMAASRPHPAGTSGISDASCTDRSAVADAAHREELFSFESDGVRLRGTLYLPGDEGPHPAVILLPGGGSNAELLRSMPMEFGPRLAACGLAALVFDKRGTGDSGGDYSASTFDDFLADTGAAMNALSAHGDVDADRIGVLGFSQGGRLAPVVAVRYPRIRFAASVSGPITSVEDTRYYAIERSFQQAGVADSLLHRVMPLWRTHLDAVAARDPDALEQLDAELARLRGDMIPGLLPPSSNAIPRSGIYNSMGRDYASELARLDVPWLAMFGETDAVVPVGASVGLIETILGDRAPGIVTIRIIPGVGHSFFNPETREWYPFEAEVIKWLVDVSGATG